MFDRASLSYWLARFCIGVLMLVAIGFGIVRGPVSPAIGLIGFSLALSAIKPLVAKSKQYAYASKPWNQAAQTDFARASLPRRIYYLLVAVAECDGPMTQSERKLVRHFLIQRFDSIETADEIRMWEMQPLPVKDRIGLAARIATSLSEPELDTLFCWCVLTTFADGKFLPDEHKALADVSRGLGISGHRARMLFHLARAQYIAEQRQQQGEQRGDYRRASPPPANARGDALTILDLPTNSSAEQIRKRHRELVRKFHPDAQPNLGPIAQKEATERFQAIQRAYEVLTDTSSAG
jgi:DnaJ-domain-containing protein 1